MKLAKSQQSILDVVLGLMELLIGDTKASFLEKGMAVASLIHLGVMLSESLVKEAGAYRSLDVGKDWWVLEDHPHIDAVRLDNDVWQVREGGTTFTYMQTPGLSETLNLHIELDDSDDDVTAIRKHIVHLKLVYPNEGQSDYLWQLHQFTTRQVGALSKQLLAESKEERVIPLNLVSFFIYNEEKDLKTMSFDDFIEEFEGFEQDEDGVPVEIDFADHQAIVAAHDAQQLWTEFDDGHLENRIAYVNRCRYLKAVKAYNEPIPIIVDTPLSNQ